MEEREPCSKTGLKYSEHFLSQIKKFWPIYLDFSVKIRNEEKEQCINAETMTNHFVQYDFLYFTPSVGGKEIQAKRVFKNVLHFSKLSWSLSLNGMTNTIKIKTIKNNLKS